MKLNIWTFLTLALSLQPSIGIPIAESSGLPSENDIEDGRRALQAAVCAEDRAALIDIPPEHLKDPNLAGRPADPEYVNLKSSNPLRYG